MKDLIQVSSLIHLILHLLISTIQNQNMLTSRNVEESPYLPITSPQDEN